LVGQTKHEFDTQPLRSARGHVARTVEDTIMRGVRPATVIAAALLSLHGLPARVSAADDPPAKPIEPEKLVVKVDGGKLFINDKAVPLPGERKTVVELLGKPSRVLDKANTLLVWDESGILIYEDPKSKKINQVTVALGELKWEFWPKKLFRGKLTLDGATVTADTTVEAINRDKKGKKFAAGGFGLFSSIDYGNTEVVIHKAKDKEVKPDGTIAEFLIGVKSVDR
jgi:hypothetical protein